MVRKVKHGFNNIFDRVEASKQRLFRSAGVIYVALFMRQSGMTGLIEKRIHDARKAGKIRYRLSDLMVRIILHILDGDFRLSCYARNPHLVLFRELFCGNEPHPTAIRVSRMPPSFTSTPR